MIISYNYLKNIYYLFTELMLLTTEKNKCDEIIYILNHQLFSWSKERWYNFEDLPLIMTASRH